ncbi:hypothetical protein ACWGE0_13550 [Lentzea sp. NPDC054927]
MKVTKAVIGLSAVATALAFAPFANAQSLDGFSLDKAEYVPGDNVTLSYDVTAKCEGKATSKGFINLYSSDFLVGGPNTMVAEASASFVPGSYTAEMTCKGEKVTRAFKVLAPRDTFSLDKSQVEAGGEVTVTKKQDSDCGDAANSPGFVSRIELKKQADGTWSGTAKAIDTPGTYQVAMLCSGAHRFKDFTIVPKTPTTQPPTSTTEKPKAKAPIVKPKGAPQTGGGGTA